MNKFIVYIDYLNKSRNFKKDRIYFSDKDELKAYNTAKMWGRKNIDNFNVDMINSLESDK